MAGAEKIQPRMSNYFSRLPSRLLIRREMTYFVNHFVPEGPAEPSCASFAFSSGRSQECNCVPCRVSGEPEVYHTISQTTP